MSKPVRIQRSRQHKQVSPNGLPIVYVGRPSKYGNPFKVGNYYKISAIGWLAPVIHEAIEAAKNNPMYVFISSNKEASELFDKYQKGLRFPHDFKELKGKNLSCWCKVGEPCHADTLLKIANE